MFLAIDECFGTVNCPYVTIGCLCLPQEKLPELEQEFIKNRQAHKLWGEVKWHGLSPAYLEKYKQVVSSYLGYDEVTFHSWTYKAPTSNEVKQFYLGKDPARVIYQQAYILIRTVIWRCRNAGYTGDFYILADQSGFGAEEYKTTARLLQGDSRITPPPDIPFCSVGNSISCGALQIADICTGATCSYYDPKLLGETTANQAATNAMVQYLEVMNNGRTLNLSLRNFRNMYDYKLHHGFEERRV